MTPDLEERIQRALDAGLDPAADPELAALMAEDPEASAAARELAGIDRALRGWPTPARSDSDWEAIAAGIEARLDEALPFLDPTEAPRFPDEQEATAPGAAAAGARGAAEPGAGAVSPSGVPWGTLAIAAAALLGVGVTAVWFVGEGSEDASFATGAAPAGEAAPADPARFPAAPLPSDDPEAEAEAAAPSAFEARRQRSSGGSGALGADDRLDRAEADGSEGAAFAPRVALREAEPSPSPDPQSVRDLAPPPTASPTAPAERPGSRPPASPRTAAPTARIEEPAAEVVALAPAVALARRCGGPSATVVVRLEVHGGTGRVHAVTFPAAARVDAAVQACLRRALRAARFERFQAETAAIDVAMPTSATAPSPRVVSGWR